MLLQLLLLLMLHLLLLFWYELIKEHQRLKKIVRFRDWSCLPVLASEYAVVCCKNIDQPVAELKTKSETLFVCPVHFTKDTTFHHQLNIGHSTFKNKSSVLGEHQEC